MIIGRSPLRITLGGGSSDLASYYLLHGGFLIAAAIDQYVYVTINHTTFDEMLLRYSQIERVKKIEDIKHPIIREALKLTNINDINIEITSMADQPSGTGLGSSGSFTTCLLKVLHKFKKHFITPQQLAEMACHIEIDLLKEPIGKQDQYIAAFGGITSFEFKTTGEVIPKSLNLSDQILRELEENLVMVSTGYYRAASKVLKEQDDKSKANDPEMINNIHYIKELGFKSLEALESGNLSNLGKIMDEHWQHKKKRSKFMSNPDIDRWYDIAMKNGAIGGKVCFAPETQIKIENGYKYIKDICLNEKVYDHKNNIQSVLSVIKSKYLGKIIEFKVYGLKNTIRVTPEHPLFTTIKHPKFKRETIDGNKKSVVNLPLFKQAKDFKKGNCLLIPVNTSIIDIENIKIERNIKQSKYSNHNIYDNIPEKIEINYDLLNTLGWFIAEGSANRKQFSFALNKKEINDAKIICNSIKNMFTKLTHIKYAGNCIYIISGSIVLSSFFNELCGKYAKNKQIPSFVMKLPIEKQSILMSALWKGDGCIRNTYDKRNNKNYIRCSYKTVSFKLAKQVQELCFRFGFICGIKEEKSIIRNKSVHQTAYTITINGNDAIYFKKFIETGILEKVKRNNKKKLSLKKDFLFIDGIKYAKRSIIDIKEIDYDGDVFNLNIDNSHTYIANDIVVHNCGAGSGGHILLYTEERKRLINALQAEGLKESKIHFDFEGTKIL